MEGPIAEYVMTAMLETVTGFSKLDASYRDSGHFKPPFPSLVNNFAEVPFHGELAGKTVGIIGYGHIGAAVAKRAVAFDMTVIGTARRPRPTPEGLEWLGTGEDVGRLLQESDFVVLACALTDETEGLIDAAALAQMKASAVLVNVARAQVCDEAALFQALHRREIGGAVVDVWWRQPSVAEPDVPGWENPAHRFDELDNCFITSHSSGWTQAGTEGRRIEAIAENLDALANGEPLQNVVATGAAGGKL